MLRTLFLLFFGGGDNYRQIHALVISGVPYYFDTQLFGGLGRWCIMSPLFFGGGFRQKNCNIIPTGSTPLDCHIVAGNLNGKPSHFSYCSRYGIR
jgi:hypothetical protein